MTEQPAQAPGPAAPAGPEHEGIGERLHDWFTGHEHQITADLKEASALAGDAQALVHGHAAGVLHIAAEILGGAAAHPELMALIPKALEIATGALTLAGAAL